MTEPQPETDRVGCPAATTHTAAEQERRRDHERAVREASVRAWARYADVLDHLGR